MIMQSNITDLLSCISTASMTYYWLAWLDIASLVNDQNYLLIVCAFDCQGIVW